MKNVYHFSVCVPGLQAWGTTLQTVGMENTILEYYTLRRSILVLKF
jgi:hypothetical protein